MYHLSQYPKQSYPQEKQKIFFCCHPADLAYLPDLAHEILQEADCILYYMDYRTGDGLPRTEKEEEEFFFDLEQMQLFVIPVTVNLLREDPETCPAMRYFRKIARSQTDGARQIPVLPILLEDEDTMVPGTNRTLGEIYSDADHFRNIQWLDRYTKDSSRIPYRERLKRDLNRFLLDDSIVKKVREAFAGRIFFSYRRVDRRYASGIMHMIHDIPSCTRMAIWYDEHLDGGFQNYRDDYQNQIKKNLEQSSIFVILVTENLLLNGRNYIQRVEFPYWMELHPHRPWTIVAIDVTDGRISGSELRKFYPGIPDPIRSSDHEALKKAFDHAAGMLSDQASGELTPDREYLIGLGFLHGIDVETDRNRAVQLISHAARMGSADAMQTLADLYSTGNGVPFDAKKAVEWAEKSAAKRAREYDDVFRNAADAAHEQVILSCLHYLASLRTCAKFHKQLLGDLQGAVQIDELGVRTAEDLHRKLGTEISEYFLMEQIEEIGRHTLESGDCDRAMNYALRAVRTGEKYRQESEVYSQRLIRIYRLLGDCQLEKNLQKESAQTYQKARDLADDLVKRNPSEKNRRALAAIYIKTGNLRLRNDEPDWAEKDYRAACKLMQDLTKERPLQENRRSLALCYENIGRILSRKQHFEKAEQYYRMALETLQILAEEKPSSENCRALAFSCGNIGDCCLRINRYAEAGHYYQMGSNIMEKQTKIPENIRTLSECLIKEGDYYADREPGLAEKYYQQGLEQAQIAAKRNPSRDYLAYYANSSLRIGSFSKRMQHYQRAYEQFDTGIKILQKLTEKYPASPYIELLQLAYEEIKRLLMKMQKPEEAEKYHAESLQLMQKLQPGK